MTERQARVFARAIAYQMGLFGPTIADAEQVGAIKWAQVVDSPDHYQRQAIKHTVVDLARSELRHRLCDYVGLTKIGGERAPVVDPYPEADTRLLFDAFLSQTSGTSADCVRLLMLGLTRAEVASIIGVHKTSVNRRIANLRKLWELFERGERLN